PPGYVEHRFEAPLEHTEPLLVGADAFGLDGLREPHELEAKGRHVVQGDVLFEAAVEFFRRVQEVRQGLLPEAELDQLAPHEQVPAQQSDIAKKADTRIAWSAVREVGFPALAGAVAGLAVVHGGAGRAAFYVRGIRTRLRERHAGDRRGADADPEL